MERARPIRLLREYADSYPQEPKTRIRLGG